MDPMKAHVTIPSNVRVALSFSIAFGPSWDCHISISWIVAVESRDRQL